jgi:hypothetical protein
MILYFMKTYFLNHVFQTKTISLMKAIVFLIVACFWTSMNAGNSIASDSLIQIYSNESDKSLQLNEEPHSMDYEVWINGIRAIVYVARVQDPPWEKEKTNLDFGGNYSFSSFNIKGPVKIKIRSLNKSLAGTILRPDNAKVKQLVKNEKEISFTLDKPIKLIIEPDGKNAPLLLFANPVIDYKYSAGDKNVIYFGPGIHKPDSAIVRVRDNQILYLAEGAIVKAGIIVSGNNTTICGSGILCGNEFVWGKDARNMLLITGNNVVVKDIVIRGAAHWTMLLWECHNIVIDNIKILGGRAQNDDGINPVNAQDVLIKNCFLRTDDDCIALKGMQAQPSEKNVERITVENTILWCDRAKTILLGHESRSEYMRNIKFQNIDVVHFGHHSIVIEPGEKMKLENVLFKNIRINGNGQKDFISIRPVVNQYMQTKVPGYVNNITINNLVLTGIAGKYRIWLAGADGEYNVSGVKITNLSILGEKLSNESKHLQIDDYVFNLKIK